MWRKLSLKCLMGGYKAKLETRGNIFLIKMSVVNEQALTEILLNINSVQKN